jgi:hypothetical protein
MLNFLFLENHTDKTCPESVEIGWQMFQQDAHAVYHVRISSAIGS